MEVIVKRIAACGAEVTLVRVVNASGAAVELSSIGAGITAVEVPDRDGVLANVCLGYAATEDYISDGPCMGKIAGRYANRIAAGHLEIEGTLHQLAINNGPNSLHGGPTGFQNRIWDAEPLHDGVRFSRFSPAGEENYPGNLRVTAEYRWNDDNELTLRLHAETDATTVVNLTSHAYWNLRGAASGSVLDHELALRASRYLATDDTLIPQGAPAPVAGTPMDFRTPKPLGRDIEADFPALRQGKGYDACWALDGAAGELLEDAAVLRCEASGRTLRIATDQPGVQVYTGNWLSGSPLSSAGTEFADYDGVAIEMQGFPDAPNRPDFPSQLLRAGESYDRVIRFSFG